jgi:hypothetical protein
MTRRTSAFSAVLATLVAACASGAQAPTLTTSPPAPSVAAATAEPSVSEASVAPTARPSADWSAITVELRPAFRVPIGELNRVAAVGDEVWAPAGDSIVRVNRKTRKTTTIDSPVDAGAADSFGATDDAVWIGDFDHGKVYRLDPTSGVVLSELAVGAPVTFGEADGLVWVGSGSTKTMVTIDPAGSKVTVTDFPHELVAGDSAWGAQGFGKVVRAVIDSGERTTIDIVEPRGPGDCSVKGSAVSLWLLCHENDLGARLDPSTNSVMATVEVGSPVFGGVQNLERWAFFLEGRDEAGLHEGRIVRVDLSTNQIDRIFDLGPEFDPNPAVVAAEALWVPIAASGELWVLPLPDLLVE